MQGAEGSRFPGRPVTTLFHTSHPGLAASLRRDRRWRQVSANLYGEPRARCIRTMTVSNARKLAETPNATAISGAAYGGLRHHFAEHLQRIQQHTLFDLHFHYLHAIKTNQPYRFVKTDRADHITGCYFSLPS